MTFYEAALEVLRQSGRPLHFKKITELAIRDSLLSHVGKTPEVTMSARLNQEVKREELSALLQPRPGIFLLKDDIAERLNEEAKTRAKTEAEEAARREEDARNNPDAADDLEEQADEEVEEDDSDETDEYSSNRPRNDRDDRSGGRSRSRRRRRRRSDQRDDDETSESGEDAEEDSDESTEEHAPTPERSSNGRSRRSTRGRSRSGRSSRRDNNDNDKPREDRSTETAETRDSDEDNKDSRGRGSRSRGGRSRGGRSSNGRSSNGRSGGRNASRSEETPQENEELEQKHLENGPVRLEGIAQAAHIVLQEADDLMNIEELATAIFKRKLVKFHTHDPALTVQSALVNDNQLRHRRGHRELFVRHANKRWGLSEWGMTLQTLRKEQQILSLSEECRQEALRLLGKTLLKVKTEALEQITLTMLEGLGYRNIKVSKRSANGDVFFSADWRQGLSDLRVCIQLTGESGEELTRDVVTDLRGTLHHYSAHEGVIIHFGDIDKNAVAESREAKLANITLIDRKTFVELTVDQGIGVKRYHTPILVVDNAYIEELMH